MGRKIYGNVSNPLVILDGAHNPQAAEALRKSLELYFKGKSCIMFLGFSG